MPTMVSSAAPSPGQIIASHQNTAPVDVVRIANDLGVKVWEMKSLPANVSGKIFRDPQHGGRSGFSIAVNSNEHLTRQRFTIAHEIAHFLLHRNYLDQRDLIDDAMYRSGLTTREEAEANNFAAQILMPIPLIQRLIDEGVTQVDALADRLEVSPTAMKIRLSIPT